MNSFGVLSSEFMAHSHEYSFRGKFNPFRIDFVTVYAKVRPKYYSSAYVQLSIYICDADDNKLFDHFQAPSIMDYKITGKTISYDWKVNISDELRKRQDQPLYCYFTIYADSFYHSDSIEIQK